MYREVVIQRLTVGALFKLTFIGLTGFWLPWLLLSALAALLGDGTVTWSERELVGWQGLLVAPFLAVVMGAVGAALLTLVLAVGLGLYSLVRPISLLVKLPLDPDAGRASGADVPPAGTATPHS